MARGGQRDRIGDEPGPEDRAPVPDAIGPSVTEASDRATRPEGRRGDHERLHDPRGRGDAGGRDQQQPANELRPAAGEPQRDEAAE